MTPTPRAMGVEREVGTVAAENEQTSSRSAAIR
jgi:hypothetical protein